MRKFKVNDSVWYMDLDGNPASGKVTYVYNKAGTDEPHTYHVQDDKTGIVRARDIGDVFETADECIGTMKSREDDQVAEYKAGMTTLFDIIEFAVKYLYEPRNRLAKRAIQERVRELESPKYAAVLKSGAVRDVQYDSGVDSEPESDAWLDLPNAEVFIGVYDGDMDKIRKQAAEYAGTDPENIRLIKI